MCHSYLGIVRMNDNRVDAQGAWSYAIQTFNNQEGNQQPMGP